MACRDHPTADCLSFSFCESDDSRTCLLNADFIPDNATDEVVDDLTCDTWTTSNLETYTWRFPKTESTTLVSTTDQTSSDLVTTATEATAQPTPKVQTLSPATESEPTDPNPIVTTPNDGDKKVTNVVTSTTIEAEIEPNPSSTTSKPEEKPGPGVGEPGTESKPGNGLRRSHPAMRGGAIAGLVLGLLSLFGVFGLIGMVYWRKYQIRRATSTAVAGAQASLIDRDDV